jgi:hypothetical protein
MNLISSIIVSLFAIMTMAILASYAVANLEVFRIWIESRNNMLYDETDEFEFRDDPYATLWPKSGLARSFIVGNKMFTCSTCCDAFACEYAFDFRNLDGDCLATRSS